MCGNFWLRKGKERAPRTMDFSDSDRKHSCPLPLPTARSLHISASLGIFILLKTIPCVTSFFHCTKKNLYLSKKSLCDHLCDTIFFIFIKKNPHVFHTKKISMCPFFSAAEKKIQAAIFSNCFFLGDKIRIHCGCSSARFETDM